MTEDARAARLADEMRTLLERTPPPVFEFRAGLLDAYTLVALLQLASRHPSMSDDQRYLAVRVASGIARTLADAAREAFGPGSEIETTLLEGFDPAYDVPEEGDFDDLDDGVDPANDVPVGATALGGMLTDAMLGTGAGESRYVSPTWIHLPGEEDAEFSKCAACSRFFVSTVPIRLWTSSEPVLGFEVCDGCAPTTAGVRRPGGT